MSKCTVVHKDVNAAPSVLHVERLEPRSLLAAAVWDGGPSGMGTSWHDAVNWVGDVLPVDGDDVSINLGSGVDYSTGVLALHSLIASRPLSILGGSLGVTAASSTSDQLTLNGGTLAGGSWLLSGPGLVITPNPGNALSAVTINGDISITQDLAFVRVVNGLTVNGLVVMTGPGSIMSFDAGVQALNGNADFLFDGFTDFRSISADAGAVLTIGPTVSFTGSKGRLTSGLVSGSGSIVNLGTIWADTPNETLDVSPSIFTNLGTLRATTGATLDIHAGNWTTSSGIISINAGTLRLGGTLDLTSGFGTFSRSGGQVFIDGTLINTASTLQLSATTGTWRFGGGQIIGGSIEFSGNATLDDYPFKSGRLSQVTVNGNLSWLNSGFDAAFDGVTLNGDMDFGDFSTLTITNNLTLNGTLTVSGGNTLVLFDAAAQSLLGNATVHLRDAEAYFWAMTPLTIPANVTVSGYGIIVGSVTNHGHFISDIPTKTLIFGDGSFHNAVGGTVSALGDARIYFGDPAGGPATFTNDGTLTATGGILAIGSTSGSGPLQFVNSGSVTIGSSSSLRIGETFVFSPITVINAGQWEVTANSTMTIGTAQALTPVIYNNTGTTRSTAGGAISILAALTTEQLGDFRASGGTVTLKSVIDNSASLLALNATTGTWNVSGGSIVGGSITFNGAALDFDSSSNNKLNGVAIEGSFALSQLGARLQIVNGLTFNGFLTISGANAALWFNGGLQLVQGKARFNFAGTSGTQTISADNGATVTFASTTRVSGISGSGQIRSGQVVGGFGSFISQGLITGNLTVDTSSFSNDGIVEALDGKTISIQGSVANYVAGTLTGGTWTVGLGSSLSFGPGPIVNNNAVIRLDGASSVMPSLDALAINIGTLSLTGGRGLAVAGDLANDGTIELSPGSTLAIQSQFSQSAQASLRLTLNANTPPALTSAASATLAGTLDVLWQLGYTPDAPTATVLISAPTRTGTFSTFHPPQNSGHTYSLSYTPTQTTFYSHPGPYHIMQKRRH